MALRDCPECKHKVAENSSKCPKCGFKFKSWTPTLLAIALAPISFFLFLFAPGFLSVIFFLAAVISGIYALFGVIDNLQKKV